MPLHQAAARTILIWLSGSRQRDKLTGSDQLLVELRRLVGVGARAGGARTGRRQKATLVLRSRCV